MELVVADSSYYIRAAREKRQPFQEMDRLDDRVDWAISGVIMLEVERGFRIPGVREEFHRRFSTMIYLAALNATWELASELAWKTDRQGLGLPVADLLIASICLQHEARLLTHDRHFQAIKGLKTAHSLSDL